MKLNWVRVFPLLGLLVAAWLLLSLVFGWRTGALAPILWALILAGGAWLAGAGLVAAGRRLPAALWLALGLLLLAVMVLLPPLFFEHEPFAPAYLENLPLLTFLLPQLLPCLALVAAALLLHSGLKQLDLPPEALPESRKTITTAARRAFRSAAAAFTLAGLLLAGGLYHLYWLFVWDSTYDSLDSFLLMLPLVTALFAAVLLAELLSGRLRLAGLVYALLVPALLIAVFQRAKLVDYRALTEARAAHISQALEDYRARQQRYPASLNQLAPWTLLAVPEPVILHGQGWCYQASTDAYHLGYVDRQHWSSPELFATLAHTQGDSLAEGDLCQAEIAQMQARYPDFYGFGR